MKYKVMSGVLASVLLVTGCTATKNTEEGLNRNNTNNFDNTRFHDNVNRNTDMTQNVRNEAGTNTRRTNTDYNVSKEAADRIVREVDGIEGAYVITTNRNAYVAATLDNQDNNMSNSSMNDRSLTNDRNISRGNNSTDIRNDRDNRSMLKNQSNFNDNVSTRNDVLGNNNRTDFRNGNLDGDKNRNSDTNRIGSNYGNVSNRTLDDDVSEDMKQQITDIVKEVDPSINNVYVSTSPDFLDLASNYSNDLENGRPVRGFFDQIGNMIERIFPDNVENNMNRSNNMNNNNLNRNNNFNDTNFNRGTNR